MKEYDSTGLDMSSRIQIGLEMMRPAKERGWGRATELAQEYGCSRSWLYELGARTKAALKTGLEPGQVGRPTKRKELMVDREYLRRAIVIMALSTGSVRSIQTGLELLFGIDRSVGHINQTLQIAGAAAKEKNEMMRVPLPVLGEADEIFAGRKPCLTVVDGRSFLVLNLTAADGRCSTHWGLTFLEMRERGIAFQDMAADGARGIRAGLRDAELTIPLRPDLFHLLRDGKRLQNSLEKKAYKAITTAEQAKRAEYEARQPKKRPGRPRKLSLSVQEADQMEVQALETHDHFCWLLQEVRRALDPITIDHHLRVPQQAQETIKAAIELLKTLPGEKLSAFTKQVDDHLDELLAPLVWLHETLSHWCANLSPELEAWALLAWQDQSCCLEVFPPAYRQAVAAIWDAFALFHRSSSLAESLHSWLRPYLSIHRGMPQWLLPLLQLFWNHHSFSRGKRSGNSPLQLAGLDDAPSLANALDNLFALPVTT